MIGNETAGRVRGRGTPGQAFTACFLFLVSLCAGVGLPLVTPTTVLAQADEPRVFDLGTAPTDGVSHSLGVSIAALIKLQLLPSANIDVNARNTEGSRSNARRLRDDDLDFAILTRLDAYHAARGTGTFAAEGPDSSLKLVTNLWTSGYHFVVRRDGAATGTLDDFLALQGRSVALGEAGSPLRDHARALFAALEVDIDQAFLLEDLGGRQAAQAFIDGDVDGFLLIDERQGGDLVAFMEEAGDLATVLTVARSEIDAINANGAPVWTPVTLPAGILTTQSGERVTIGMRNLLCVGERVEQDAVYQITQTIFDNLPFLKEMHPATVSIGMETALEEMTLPVHDGAAAYYTETGITVPGPETARISTLSQAAFLTRFESAEEARRRLNDDTVTLLGAQSGQTVTRMISELAASLGDTGLRVVGMTSPESAENIADVLYARGVDGAIVPLDILDYALEQDVYPDIQSKVVYATELFAEEVHLLAAGGILDIEDLIDRPVNLGPKGSASAFTASFILDRFNIPVQATYHDQQTALARLKSGEIDALFVISGKPMPLLAGLPAEAGLRLLDVPPLAGDAYKPAALSAADYPQLLTPIDEVTTFAVRTVLLSYDWRTENPRYEVLSAFTDALFDRLPTLQRPGSGFHPKWQEIDPRREVPGWRRAPAAQRWIDRQDRTGVQPVATGG